MTRTEALQVMVLLCAAYPTYPVDDATTDLYVAAVADERMDVGLAAVSTWVKTKPTFPKVNELLEAFGAERRARARGVPNEIDAAPERLTPEQKAKNLERLRDLKAKLRDVGRMPADPAPAGAAGYRRQGEGDDF